MKTQTEIRELLNRLKESGDLRKDPTFFVLVELLGDLNDRLAALENVVGHRLPSLESEVKALQFFAARLHARA